MESKNNMKMSLQEATAKALYDQLDDKEEIRDVEGVVDDVLVITDPEITKDEYEEVIERAQEIVEDTPEGDIPFDDEYLGQYLQTCPICGSSFVEDHLLEPGATCPICLEQPEAFVVVGKIDSDDAVAEELGIGDNIGDGDIDGEEPMMDDELDVEPVPNTVLNRTREPDVEEIPVEEPEETEETEEAPARSGGRRLANLRNRETASKEIPAGNKLAENKLEETATSGDAKNKYEFKAGYYEWQLLKNGKVIAVFNDFVDELPDKCTEKNLRDFIDDYLLAPRFVDEDDEDYENIQEFNETIESADRAEIIEVILDRLFYEYGDLDESKKMKTETAVRDGANNINADARYKGEVTSLNGMLADKIADIAEELGDDYSEWLGEDDILEIIDTIVASKEWEHFDETLNQLIADLVEDKVAWIRKDDPASKYYDGDLSEFEENKKVEAHMPDYLVKDGASDIETACNIVEWLSTHNKNYTNDQYEAITTLAELLGKLKGTKVTENATEDYWDMKEIARDGFMTLGKFNFGTDVNGNNYIITVDANDVKRFRANSDDEAIKIYNDFKNEWDNSDHADLTANIKSIAPRNESKTIVDNGDETYTIDTDAKTYTIKTTKGEKTFTFDEMDNFVNQGKGMNRMYKPMSVLAYTDYKNGNLNKWKTKKECL